MFPRRSFETHTIDPETGVGPVPGESAHLRAPTGPRVLRDPSGGAFRVGRLDEDVVTVCVVKSSVKGTGLAGEPRPL